MTFYQQLNLNIRDRKGQVSQPGIAAGAGHILGLALCCLLLQACGGAAEKGEAREERERPNIIFLLTDDHRWDALGYAGNPIIQTPNLDEMADEGVYFPNAYVTTSICCVSRASILSGQYGARHRINDFVTPFTDSALAQTYPVLLRAAGYRTGFIGKYGVGIKEKDMPKGSFDYWRGFRGQGTYNHEDEEGNYRHLTGLIGDQAVEFLRQGDTEQPFCLSVSFKAGHVEGGRVKDFIPDPALRNLYAEDTIPVPATGDDRFYEAFPAFFKADNEGRKRWKNRFSTPEKYQESVKKYYRLISGVDRVLGRIREVLAEKGQAENTVIIFTGDNGFYLGEHGLAGKWFGHEESVRVPLIYYDPRLQEGQRNRTRTEIALNIDMAPTMLSLAGVNIPERMQGRDLTQLFIGEAPAWRENFYYEYHFGFNGKIPQTEGIIGGRYKYLRYTDPNPDYEVLYDLESDPHEISNLAADPEHREVLEPLREQWRELKKEVE